MAKQTKQVRNWTPEELAERITEAYRADAETWPEMEGYVANMGALHVSLFDDQGRYVDSAQGPEALKRARVAVAVDAYHPVYPDDADGGRLLYQALTLVPEDVGSAVVDELEYQLRRNKAGYGPPFRYGSFLLGQLKAAGKL